MGRRHRRKGEERRIARRRIGRLFELAHRRTLAGEQGLADRSVALARRIAMRYQTGLRPAQRDRICRGCSGYLAPGSTARVRVTGGVVRVSCQRCGTVRRRPFWTEQRQRRRDAHLARTAVRPQSPAEPAADPKPETPEPSITPEAT